MSSSQSNSKFFILYVRAKSSATTCAREVAITVHLAAAVVTNIVIIHELVVHASFLIFTLISLTNVLSTGVNSCHTALIGVAELIARSLAPDMSVVFDITATTGSRSVPSNS